MTLEEFFAQKAPKNYVEYPPESVPTLDKFFAERAPKKAMSADIIQTKAAAPVRIGEVKSAVPDTTPEVKSISEQTPNISEEAVQNIIQEYSPGMNMQPQMPQMYGSQPEQPQAMPAQNNYGIDYNQIRGLASEMAPKATTSDLLVGLAPLAVEALFGKGAPGAPGAAIAGQYYTGKAAELNKRQQTLEDKLMEIAKAKELARAKAGGLKTLEVDVNGKPIITPVEKAVGMQAWKAPAKQSGLSFEDFMAREAFKNQLKKDLAKSKMSDKDKKDIMDREMKLAKEWSSDEFTKGTRQIQDSFNRISSLNPYNANRVEEMGAIFDLMKGLDPRSVVRESEQQMAIGARSYEDVANYFGSILTGERKLTPTQVLNIKKFAAKLYARRMESQKLLDQGYISRAGRYNLNPENIVQKFSTGVPVLWKNTSTGRVDVIVVPEDQANNLPEGAQRIR